METKINNIYLTEQFNHLYFATEKVLKAIDRSNWGVMFV